MDYYALEQTTFRVLDTTIKIADERLSRALEDLSQERREVILLSYLLDMKDREIAEQLGQSFPRRLVRGREALLKNLRDSSPGRSLLGGGQGFALILTGRVCLCRTAFLGLSLRFVSIGEVSQGRRQHLLR